MAFFTHTNLTVVIFLLLYYTIGCGHDSNRTGSHLAPSVDELEYHMDNNPLCHITLFAGHTTMKLQHEYETVDITGISSESTNRTEMHAM